MKLTRFLLGVAFVILALPAVKLALIPWIPWWIACAPGVMLVVLAIATWILIRYICHDDGA